MRRAKPPPRTHLRHVVVLMAQCCVFVHQRATCPTGSGNQATRKATRPLTSSLAAQPRQTLAWRAHRVRLAVQRPTDSAPSQRRRARSASARSRSGRTSPANRGRRSGPARGRTPGVPCPPLCRSSGAGAEARAERFKCDKTEGGTEQPGAGFRAFHMTTVAFAHSSAIVLLSRATTAGSSIFENMNPRAPRFFIEAPK